MSSESEEDAQTTSFEYKVNIRRVWSLLRHELGMVLVCLIVMVLKRIASLMENTLGGSIVDCFQSGNWEGFVWQTSYLSASYIAYSFFRVIESYLVQRIDTNITRRIKSMLFNKLIYDKPQAFFDESKSGELATLLSSDCEQVGANLSEILPAFVTEIFEVLFGLSFMIYTNWRLSGAIAILMPIMALATWVETKVETSIKEDHTKLIAEANGKATEALMYIKTVRIFGQQRHEVNHFESIQDRVNGLSRKLALASGIANGFVTMGYHICLIATFWYGGSLVFSGAITAGEFLAFSLFAMGLSGSVNYLPDLSRRLTTVFVSSERVFSIVEDVSEVDLKLKTLAEEKEAASKNFMKSSKGLTKSAERLPEPSTSTKTSPTTSSIFFTPRSSHVVKGLVKFENVHFSYPSRPHVPVLQDFNLTIQPGQSAAVVGASGGGKSTIVSLLTRFYDISSGRITVDGIDISTVDPAWLRKQIGLVSQEPVLFSGTIRENICYGLLQEDPEMDHLRQVFNPIGSPVDGSTRPVDALQSSAIQADPSADNSIGPLQTYSKLSSASTSTEQQSLHSVSQERLEQVARMANAHDFIIELPQGYDTKVGERGSLLSAGQRQRIAIARALLRDPKILITDEATSALDNSSERVVQQALERLMQGRTCLVIAHRLSTIRTCDPICYMGKGKILEMGSHADLLAIPQGHYAKLCSFEETTDNLNASMALLIKEEQIETTEDDLEAPQGDASLSQPEIPSNPLEETHSARSRISTLSSE